MRKTLLLALCVLMLGSAATAFATGEKEAGAAPVEIRMVMHVPNYEVPINELAAKYSALKKNVTVKFEVIPNYDATWEKTQFAGKTAPEILFTHNMVDYGQQGLLIALDKALAEKSPYTGKVWKESFVGGNIERYAAPDGTPYMVPLDMTQQAIYYNKTVFTKLGIAVPKTWSQWIAAMDKIQAAGYIPLSINGTGPSGSTFVWSERVMTDVFFADKFDKWNVKKTSASYKGRNYSAPDGDPFVDILENLDLEEIILAFRSGELDPAKAPQYREIATFMKKLAGYGGKGFVGLNNDGQYEQFITQKATMMYQGSSAAVKIAKDMKDMPADRKFEWGVFPYPNFEKADTKYAFAPSRGAGGVGIKLAVSKSTPEKEAAAIDFLRYIMAPENASVIMQKGDPVGPSALVGVQAGDVFNAFGEVKGTSKWFYYMGLDGEGEDTYRRALQEFLLDKLTVDQFLKAYSEAAAKAHERQIKDMKLDLDPSTP